MTDETQGPTPAPEPAVGAFRFRDTTRAPFSTIVRLRFDRLGGSVSAESADISMEGMFVKTEEPRPVGTLVQFEFDVEPSPSAKATGNQTGLVQGLGDVVWVRANGGANKPAGMGIQFRYVDSQSREHVYQIVSEFIREISGGSAQSVPGDGEGVDGPHSLRGDEALADFGVAAEGLDQDELDLDESDQISSVSEHEEEESRLEEPAPESLDAVPSEERQKETEKSNVEAPPATIDFGSGEAAEALSGPLSEPSSGPLSEPSPFATLLTRQDEEPAEIDWGSLSGSSGSSGSSDRDQDSSDHETQAAATSSSGSFSLSVPRTDLSTTGMPISKDPGETAESEPMDPEYSTPPRAEADDQGRQDQQGAGENLGESELDVERTVLLTERPAWAQENASLVAPDEEGGEVPSGQSELDHGAFGQSDFDSNDFGGEQLELDRSDDVERYVDGTETPAIYGGSSSKESSVNRWLIVAIVLGALALAAYVFKPWQLLSGNAALNSDQVSPAAASDGDGSMQDSGVPGAPVAGSAESTDQATDAQEDGVSEEAGPAEDQAAGSQAEPQGGEEPSAATRVSADSPTSPATGSAERRIDTISASDLADRTQVRIASSGRIQVSEFSAAALSQPPRYLVKIRGIDQIPAINSRSSRFSNVRTGLHEVNGGSELHIVFDMTSPQFEADIRLEEGELLVTFR